MSPPVVSCRHPYCPLGSGTATWAQLWSHPSVQANVPEQGLLATAFAGVQALAGGPVALPSQLRQAVKRRLLKQAPCLYTQVNEPVTAAAVVHLCETTLGQPLSSANVQAAFHIQDPTNNAITFMYPPLNNTAKGGDIMEQLCSRLLSNEGIPEITMHASGWPVWTSPGHISLNAGKYSALKMYGDILIPAAPHNILISVKSVKARERFLVSGNRLESVGFGFFDQASEFWSVSRMKLFKRWGFVGIYMPADTLDEVTTHLQTQGTANHAINVNGNPLYRSLSTFTSDMRRIAGRITLDL